MDSSVLMSFNELELNGLFACYVLCSVDVQLDTCVKNESILS